MRVMERAYALVAREGLGADLGPVASLFDGVIAERGAMGLAGGFGLLYVDWHSGERRGNIPLGRFDAETLKLTAVDFVSAYGTPSKSDLFRANRAGGQYVRYAGKLCANGLDVDEAVHLSTLEGAALDGELDRLGLEGDGRERAASASRRMRAAAEEMDRYLAEYLGAAAASVDARAAAFHELEHFAFDAANPRAAAYHEAMARCGYEPGSLGPDDRQWLVVLAQDVLPASEAVAHLASEVYRDGGFDRLGDEPYRASLEGRVSRVLDRYAPVWASQLADLGYRPDVARDAARGMVLRGREVLGRSLAVAAEGGLEGLQARYAELI